MPAVPDAAAPAAALSHRDASLIAAGVLLLAAAGWFMLGRTPAAASLAPPTSPLASLAAYAAPADSSAAPATPAPGQAVALTRDPFSASAVYHPVERHVPLTGQPTDAGSVSQSWRVSAVLITTARRAAVINDSLVDQGAALPGGARLTSVEPDRVVVTDARGSRHTIAAHEGPTGESL